MIKTGKHILVVLLSAWSMLACAQSFSFGQTTEKEQASTCRDQATAIYWPTAGWRSCEPETVGMDAVKLTEAIDYVFSPEFRTDGFIVIRNGYVVAEKYRGSFRQEDTHTSYSMAKSFTSALVGIAIDKGLISGLDKKICRYYDDWDCNDQNDLRSRITIRHTLTLTTGLAWNEDWSTWDFKTNDALRMSFSEDFVKYMSERPGLYEPGQQSYYSTGDPMLLTQVLQEATGMTVLDFGKENLFTPLNFSKIKWDADRAGHTGTATGLHATVRDYAKFGFLFLNKGYWENQQIVPEYWVDRSTQVDSSVNMINTYGYLWHVNLAKKLKDHGSLVPTDSIPSDAFMAAGVLGQAIVIIPSKNLVIVKVANQRKQRIDMGKLITLVLNAVKSS
jgi:CubicO group peptidase (beta-lactamase class C family)